MKRIVSLVLVVGLVMALAPFASAQGGPAVTGKGGEDRAVGIQVSGTLDLQMRYWDSGFATGRVGNSLLGGLLGPITGADAQWVGSPKLTLDVAATLADKALVLAELQVPRFALGENVNTFGSVSSLGSGGNLVTMHQLYLKLDQLVTPDLSVTFGIQELVFDVRGSGNPLVIALGRAEPIDPVAFNGRTVTAAGGLRGDYKLGQAGTVTAFHMIVIDGYSVQRNEYCTGADVMFKLDDKNTIEGLVALTNGLVLSTPGGAPGLGVLGKDSEIWIIGAGADSKGAFVPGLDLNAQIYFNAGDYGQAGDNSKIKANGLMFDIGASYVLDMAWKPTFGAEYLYTSGSKTTDKKQKNFLSYEDNNDLLVIEDKEFGFDIDTNYNVIKLRASISGDLLASPVKDAFSVEALLGIAKFTKKVATNTGAPDTNKLGTELDIKASWMATKQLKVYAGLGWLFSSKYVKEVVGDPDGDPAKNSAFTLMTGTTVTF
jgi:hypothetical protein